MELKTLSLAIAAVISLSGCHDNSDQTDNAQTKPDHSQVISPPDIPVASSASKQLRTMMTLYTKTIDSLSRNQFGDINDQYADSKSNIEYDFQQAASLIDRSSLSAPDKIYYDMFVFDRDIAVRGSEFSNQRFGSLDTPITHFNNTLVTYAGIAGKSDDIIVIKDFTQWIGQLSQEYHEGQVEKIELSHVMINQYMNSINQNLAKNNYELLNVGLDKIDKSKMVDKDYRDFVSAHDAMVMAVKDLVNYISGEYANNSQGQGTINDKNVGWGALPNGTAWYQWHLDRNSTSGKSANELFKLGDELTKNGNDEMIRVAKIVASKENAQNWYDTNSDTVELSKFFDFLNTDRFVFGLDGNRSSGTPYAERCQKASDSGACEASMTDYYAAKDAIIKLVPKFFKPIKTNYDIQPIVAGSEDFDGVGSYSGDSGTFNLNTKPHNSLQKWNVSTLTMHEAGFGHHLQHAYSVEYPAKNVPEYFKDTWYTAYGEGWALYVEDLAKEANMYGVIDKDGNPTFINSEGICKEDQDYSSFSDGAYKDAEECNALQYFGQLNEAQLRNMRLVIDTAIHNKGWSIKEAREYMHAHSALGAGDIASETMRYTAYVGQAVSYKSGYLALMEAKAYAKDKLGNRFSYPEFHDQILKYGAQPLEVLSANLKLWADSK